MAWRSSVRLSNNRIASVEGVEGDEGSRLSTALADVCADINALRWIDVSFNQISRIGDAFAHFPHVTVLYLHANNIASLSQVKALGELKELNDLNYDRQDEYHHIMMKLKKRLAKLDELYVETDELYKGDVADAIKEDKAKEAAEAQPAAADGGS